MRQKNLSSRQVISRMRRGDLPINRWGTCGMLFDDGARTSGRVLRTLMKSNAVVRPTGGSGLRPYRLAYDVCPMVGACKERAEYN